MLERLTRPTRALLVDILGPIREVLGMFGDRLAGVAKIGFALVLLPALAADRGCIGTPAGRARLAGGGLALLVLVLLRGHLILLCL